MPMRIATEVFGEWAEHGKDTGMEKGHAIPVDEMINYALKERSNIGKKFSFLDLGCGSGRVIDFFTRSFPKKEFIGIEYFSQQFEYCKNSFDKNDNVKIIQADFTKIDIMKLNSDYFFLAAPFKNNHDLLNFVEKIISLSNKKIFFIIINYNKKTIEEIKNIEIIETYYIRENAGYSICCSNNI